MIVTFWDDEVEEMLDPLKEELYEIDQQHDYDEGRMFYPMPWPEVVEQSPKGE